MSENTKANLAVEMYKTCFSTRELSGLHYTIRGGCQILPKKSEMKIDL